jgi:hypothetical protein
MAKDDFYRRLLGIAPEPPTTTLSKLLGLDPPALPVIPTARMFGTDPVSAPISRPSLRSLASLMSASAPPPQLPMPDYSSIGSLIGAPKPQWPVPPPSWIWFQNRCFSEPTAFGDTWLPTRPGVYAILVIDGTWRPRPYRPIYFGKAGNLASRLVPSHEKYDEWCRVAGGAGKLYIAYHLVPDTDWERAAVEEDLIKHYAPQCNDIFNPFSRLLGGRY